MKNTISLTFTLLCVLASCTMNQDFDSTKWKQYQGEWLMSDKRERMIDDLIESDTLIGLNKSQITNLLGSSEYSDTSFFKYTVREKYGWDIDPEYITELFVEFDFKGSVTRCYIQQ